MRLPPPLRLPTSRVPLGLLLLAAGCNNYDTVIHQHYDQAAFSNKVDVLWIVDNSNSMQGNQDNVKNSFEDFITAVSTDGGEEGGPTSFNNLGDLVAIYQDLLSDRSKYLDYQMGFTTTQRGSCGTDNDQQTADECLQHGVSGKLRPLTGGTDPFFLVPSDEDLQAHFIDLVDMDIKGATTEYGVDVAALTACLSICPPGWHDEVEYNDAGQVTTAQCVADDGSGTPATWSGLAEDDPWYPFCHGTGSGGTVRIPDEDVGYNLGFLRDDATLVVVVVTDEGDATPNLDPDVSDCLSDPEAEECDCELQHYLNFFDTLDRKTVFAVIGPQEECNEQNSSLCMISFYQSASEVTGGLFSPIDVREADTCSDANFSEVLGNIGSLIGNLDAEWPLDHVPVCPSEDNCQIQVFVNGDPVERDSTRLNGWDYYPEGQSVRFYGDAVPQYNAQVDIYYLPEESGGRSLPF